MAVKILKGQEIHITKNRPGLKIIKIALGWEMDLEKQLVFDLDSSVVLCCQDGKAIDSKHFVFYNNSKDPAGSVLHLGDSKAGGSEEEEIIVFLDKIPHLVSRLIFAISIYQGLEKKQSFGQIENSYLKIIDKEADEEMIRFDLSDVSSEDTGLIVGELYKEEEEWKFRTSGLGFVKGLEDIIKYYGLS